MLIRFKHRGSFTHTEKFLKKAKNLNVRNIFESYGQKGVMALSEATPIDTGMTARSWSYTVTYGRGSASISWTNANAENGVPVVILIQYGHGTRGGGFVQGRDFINPAIKPVMDEIANAIWKEVSNL